MCNFKIWDERCGSVMDDTKSLLVMESRGEGGRLHSSREDVQRHVLN